MAHVALFLRAFIPLFVAVDPIGLAAVFLALGSGVPLEVRRRIARQATVTGGAVAVGFLFLGEAIFRTLGISGTDFLIAGGLILLLIAARDLVQSAAEEPPKLAEDFGVVPLGMPLIAGPACITTLLLLSETLGWRVTFAALAANLVLIAGAFLASERIGAWVGVTGLRAVSKIISMLLAAIAVHMIRAGWTGR